MYAEKKEFLLEQLTQEHVPEIVREHSLEVADLVKVLAQLRGLSNTDVNILELAGLGHDLGKLDPDYLRSLNGELKFGSPVVKDARYNHPSLGAVFLAKEKFPRLCILVVLQHHERYDGRGYPNGLTGNQINERSKLFGLGDYLSSLKFRGPNGSSGISDIEERADIIRGEFGTCLDPEYRPIFEELINYCLENKIQ